MDTFLNSAAAVRESPDEKPLTPQDIDDLLDSSDDEVRSLDPRTTPEKK